MSLVVLSPIHVEAIGLSNVRFFAPPTGAREFPWPSLDDLFAAVVMDRRMRRAFRADIGSSMWAGNVRQIVTPDGRTLIGQHLIARGIIDALVAAGQCPADLYGAYGAGVVVATAVLLPGIGPDALMVYARDAMAASGGCSE